MIYLHKVLPLFVLPVMIFILLNLIGLVKNKKIIIYISTVLLYVTSTPIFSNYFFKIIEGEYYRKPIKEIDFANSIVVLSGMMQINEFKDNYTVEWGDADRFFAAIDLFNSGKAESIVFTGGKSPFNKTIISEGEILKKYAISNGISKENIMVTKDVENTADEAMAVKSLIGSNKNIILVTSAFHMFRAKKMFEKQGFNVNGYKVDYRTPPHQKLTIMSFLPSSANLSKTEVGIREVIGRIFYFIKGYN
ncbi:MAG: uncharacterized SAM-binding protein YcdF (DUF218 family) [Flavobacteriaceae bacterium]|jgi:uncharacterized SAM-binding protein YcdF (DUF218 family)